MRQTDLDNTDMINDGVKFSLKTMAPPPLATAQTDITIDLNYLTNIFG